MLYTDSNEKEMRNKMNKLSHFKVAGTLANGSPFSTTVIAMYGYDAIKKATAIVGKVATASAMRVAEQTTEECIECGDDVPMEYHATHACIRLV
jgi:hypothetical protein